MLRMMTAGFVLQVHTDETWKARRSPVEHLGLWQNGNFGGDRYDVISLLTEEKRTFGRFSLVCCANGSFVRTGSGQNTRKQH